MKPVPELMDGWIFQPGFPLVTANVSPSFELTITQQRFSYLSETQSGPSQDQRWQIPLQMRVIAAGKTKILRMLLTEKSTTVPLPHDWESVLINEGGHGFYRVCYAPDLLNRLLNTGIDRLAVTERFNLINDAWATTVAGLMPLTDYLDLTARFTAERDKNCLLYTSPSPRDRG